MNKSLTTVSPVFKKKVKVGLEESKFEAEGFAATHFDSSLIKTWRNENVLKESEDALYVKNYKGSPLLIELTLFKKTVTQE